MAGEGLPVLKIRGVVLQLAPSRFYRALDSTAVNVHAEVYRKLCRTVLLSSNGIWFSALTSFLVANQLTSLVSSPSVLFPTMLLKSALRAAATSSSSTLADFGVTTSCDYIVVDAGSSNALVFTVIGRAVMLPPSSIVARSCNMLQRDRMFRLVLDSRQ